MITGFMAGMYIQSSHMGEREQRVIEDNEPHILELMDPDKISTLLLSKGIIDGSDRRQVMLPRDNDEKKKILVGKILTRGQHAFQAYIDTLHESGTDDHLQLAKILQKDTQNSTPHRADEMVQQSRDRRMEDKLKNHEQRLRALELSDSDIKSLQAKLAQKHEELTELRKELGAHKGENQALKKRITELETQVQSLEAQLETQKTVNKQLCAKQVQSEQRIAQLEDQNTDINEQLQAQAKVMSDIQGQIKSMVPSSSGTVSNTGTRQATRPPITPMNRFQSQEQAPRAKATAAAQRDKKPTSSAGCPPPKKK